MGLKHRLLVTAALIATASACQGNNETTPTTRVLPPVSSWAPAPSTTTPPTTLPSATTEPPATTVPPTTEPRVSIVPGPTTEPSNPVTVSTIAEVANLDDPAFQAEIGERVIEIHRTLNELLAAPSDETARNQMRAVSSARSTWALGGADFFVSQGRKSMPNPDLPTILKIDTKNMFSTGEDLVVKLCVLDRHMIVDAESGDVLLRPDNPVAMWYTLIFENGKWVNDQVEIEDGTTGQVPCDF